MVDKVSLAWECFFIRERATGDGAKMAAAEAFPAGAGRRNPRPVSASCPPPRTRWFWRCQKIMADDYLRALNKGGTANFLSHTKHEDRFPVGREGHEIADLSFFDDMSLMD